MTITETQSRIVDRALAVARKWYPPGAATVTVGRVEGGTVTLLVEVDGDIRTVKYTDLDA